MKQRLLAGIMSLVLLMSLLPAAAFAAGGTTHTIPDEDTTALEELLKNGSLKDGDVIELQGTSVVGEINSGEPLVIDKEVTFRGGKLTLWPGGILLGADVTFEDMSLALANRQRNVIMANGHTLTLNNVTADTSVKQSLHLICGGLTGHKTTATAGDHGRINIQGNTSLNNQDSPGNIYAGSLSSNGVSNSSSLPATITIDPSATGKTGEIYACGAKEFEVSDNEMMNPNYVPGPPAADPAQYAVSGDVEIRLYGGVVPKVDGATGGGTNADVRYTGGPYPSTTLEIENVSSLTVEDGQLRPKVGDISGADVTVAAGAELSLVRFGNAVATNGFVGGGTVVLGENQTWTISGAVSGTTQIAIDGIWNDASQTVPQIGHTYIKASNSAEDSFTLLPYSTQPDHKLVRDASGNWTAQDGPAQEAKVKSASLPAAYSLGTDNRGAEIPVDVNYEPVHDWGILSEIPMDVKIGNYTVTREKGEYGYIYKQYQGLTLEFAQLDDGEILAVTGNEANGGIKPGSYAISCTIPGEFTVGGQPITFSTTLQVAGGAAGDVDLGAAAVTVNGTYVYTGRPIVPDVTVTVNNVTLIKDTHYTVTASNNTDAGSATVTVAAVPSSGYTGSHTTTFTIGRVPLTVSGAAIAGKTYDGGTNTAVQSVTLDNALTDLKPDQDYAASGEFDDPNAGDNKSVTVTVSLRGRAANNYDLQNQGRFVLTGQRIGKAAAAPKTGSLLVTNGLQADYTYDLPQLLPDLPAGQDFGRVTYTVGAVSLGSYYTSGAAVQDGVLTLPIQEVQGQEGAAGTVTIQIETDNFTLQDAVIQVSAGNKQVPRGEPALTPSRLTYGQPLSAIALSGDMRDMDGNAVTGRFAWNAPDTMFSAGAHNASWTFTPDNSAVYAAVTGSAEIAVDRAVPSGQPGFQTIAAAGKTLADAKLTAAFSVPGVVRWKLPDTTPVAANTAYEWEFAPDDAQNYEPLSGSIVLWTASSSGGHGSSSNTTTETTKNPDGSTTTTVTNKAAGTVTETTRFPDGSKEVVERRKDGTVTTTATDAAGNKTEVVENADGSGRTTVDNKDGSGSVTLVDENGRAVSEATLSKSAVEAAQGKGEAAALPMPEARVTADRNAAPLVTVRLPGGGAVKVEIPVAQATPGTVAVIVKAGGAEEVIRTSLTTENGVAVTLSDGDTVKIVDNGRVFDDVPDNYWGAEAVAFVSSRELFEGTGAVAFSPDMRMDRGMIVTVLARFAGVDTTAGNVWYEAGQRWAMENGISDGDDMEESLSREQLAAMLWRYAGSPSASADMSGYKDAGAVSPYARQAMAWCVEQGVIDGVAADSLSPQAPAARAQVAAILMRFIENTI